MKTDAKVLKFFLLAAVLLCPLLAPAQLAVTVSPPKVVGQKAVVQLKMKNNLATKIESARAACFLLDGQGKVIGQTTKWVIGKSGLESKGEATFNFVVSSRQPFTTTNLTARVRFSRVNLDSGPVADVAHEVVVSPGVLASH
jgi:opacity protein-like surface antigen